MSEISIVHWLDGADKHRCGYCKNESSNISYGMWAESLTVDDYQDLIDRGWRRSGKYCYKPIMDQTCCPQYTIKCDALNFAPSKSHKKLIKKFNKYLSDEILGNSSRNDSDDESDAIQPSTSKNPAENQPKRGVGADPTKPPCKKAKLLRMEKKQEKFKRQGMDLGKTCQNPAKTLEQFLQVDDTKIKLQIKLISLRGEDWDKSKIVEFDLYKKYQTIIHSDPIERLTFRGFDRFLRTSPLKTRKINENFSFGTFHQQYWFNDKLIAVGVIDILPKCISSVYFFYDPDYRNLTLGTYGSLREVEFTRYLSEIVPTLKEYYMGFYIHSCPKMRYKANLSPSFLLCPETYHWIEIDQCLPKLDVGKYARFSSDDSVDENLCGEEDLNKMRIYLTTGVLTTYDNSREFQLIGKLIGKKCVEKLIFVKN